MKVVTANEMKTIDRITIDEVGIPALVLMERAGVSVAKRVAGIFGIEERITVLCGAGNNGGDGLVCARELFNNGFIVKAIIISEAGQLSTECQKQYEICTKLGVDVAMKTTIIEQDIDGSVIIDAILGTGLDRPIKDNLLHVIALANNLCGKNVVAIDIPTGISSDTGQVMGTAIEAGWTVTFGLPKRGHMLYPGKEHTGTLFVEDIGFPTTLLNSINIKCEVLEKELISLYIPQRSDYSYKGDYGHVLVVGGAKGKAGAALLASRASLRTGAGLVTMAVPNSLADVYQVSALEEMVLPVADDGRGGFSRNAIEEILNFAKKKSCVIAVGPGITVTEDTIELVKQILINAANQLIIDADALNCIASNTKNEIATLLSNTKEPAILTPHTGEMARLIGSYTDIADNCKEIESNRITVASNFARESSIYLVLKGVPSIISDPEGTVFLNPTGSPSMATAGAGDCLTGMIAALVAQGLSPLFAVQTGVYMHGLAGELSAQNVGLHSTLASDIIENIPKTFKFLLNPE